MSSSNTIQVLDLESMELKQEVKLEFNEKDGFLPTTIKSLDNQLTMIGGMIKVFDEEYGEIDYFQGLP